MLLVDSATTQVVHAPASNDEISPVQQATDVSMVLGGRVSSGNNEGYIYITPNLVPEGWKLSKYQVNWSLRNTHSSSNSPTPSLASMRTGFYSRRIKNNNGNLIGTYVQEHYKSGATDGTNVLKTISTPWIPISTDPSFGVIWCAIDKDDEDSHGVFTGGFCYIERV
jgi:hypothetical protein